MAHNILDDDLGGLPEGGARFVTFGEVMIRDTPADSERAERTRLVHLSPAGSEYTLAIGLARLGIPSSFITRLPRNPYGLAVQGIAREHSVNTDHFVWAPSTEPIGRLIYELGRTPRKNRAVYQRMYSAASRFGPGMVDWKEALADAQLFHASGINFALSLHSGYETNFNEEAFREALAAKPGKCLVGFDLNYRASLWTPEVARKILTGLIEDHVDILITTIEDIAQLYDIGIGSLSPRAISDGEIGTVTDDELRSFAGKLIEMFHLRAVALTLRYPDSFEQHRWESAAMNGAGNFHRSAKIRPITLLDRLGGGDTWSAGFYYGLITAGLTDEGLAKGIVVGDAFTRLKQTLMFDLPIVDKREVQELITSDQKGGGKRTSR